VTNTSQMDDDLLVSTNLIITTENVHYSYQENVTQEGSVYFTSDI